MLDKVDVEVDALVLVVVVKLVVVNDVLVVVWSRSGYFLVMVKGVTVTVTVTVINRTTKGQTKRSLLGVGIHFNQITPL